MPIVANFLPLNTSLIRRVCANFDKLQALPLGEENLHTYVVWQLKGLNPAR